MLPRTTSFLLLCLTATVLSTGAPVDPVEAEILQKEQEWVEREMQRYRAIRGKPMPVR